MITKAKYQIISTDIFEAELEGILNYYRKNKEFINKFLEMYYTKLEELQLFPKANPEYKMDLPERYRVCIMKQYKIYYIVENDYIILNHIIHGSRDETKILY